MAATSKHPILLVDDEPEILFSLQGLLRLEFDLHTAQSGAEALAILERQPMHVLVTDQRMPQMTGVELLTRARQICPQTIRLLFTGYADIRAVVDAINFGQVYRYLTKPWDPDDLLTLLHQACDEYDRAVQRHRLLLDLRSHLDWALGKMVEGSFGPAEETQFQKLNSKLVQQLDEALALATNRANPSCGSSQPGERGV